MNTVPVSASLHAEAHRARVQALRGVALLELGKGLVVIGAVVALRWLDPSDIAGALLNFLHISPDRHFAHFLLSMADKLSNVKFWHVAVVGACYSGLRFAEAIGLWGARPWAEWIALISGALYLPFELRAMAHRISLFHAAVLIVNLAIVGFMFYLRLYVPRREKQAARADIQ